MKAEALKKELSKINKRHWNIIFANPKEYSKLYEAYINEIQVLIIEYAKAKEKEENTRLHDRFIEVISPSIFESPDDYLNTIELIFNEDCELTPNPDDQ